MARMTIDEKATRLLDSDRIDRVDHDEIEAYRVIGNGGTYFVIVELGKVEACTCPAGQFGSRCYHAAAVTRMLRNG